VLHCGSFSKCLARAIGSAGLRRAASPPKCRSAKIGNVDLDSLPIQDGIALYLRQDGYDAHLAKLRATLGAQQSALLASLAEHFPSGYRATRRKVSYFVWVELPRGVDTLELHRLALEQGSASRPDRSFRRAVSSGTACGSTTAIRGRRKPTGLSRSSASSCVADSTTAQLFFEVRGGLLVVGLRAGLLLFLHRLARRFGRCISAIFAGSPNSF